MNPFQSWLFAFLLITACSLSLVGQPCPTIPEALAAFYAAKDDGTALENTIRAHCVGANDSLSILFHKRSVYAYSSEQDLEGAIQYGLRALAVQRELYAKGPEVPLGKSLANLGLFYRLNGQYSLALPYLKEADSIFEELEIYSRRHNNQQQLVKLWQSTGDLGQAQAVLEIMLEEAKAILQEDAANLTALIAEAETLRLQGEQANQARTYDAGLPAFEAAASKFENLGDLASLLMTYMGEGRAYFHLERFPEAQAVTEKALELAKDYDLNYDKAVMYNLLALTHQEQGELEAGEKDLVAGEVFAQAYGGPEVLSTYANTRATLAAEKGELRQSIAANTDAIAYLIKDWNYSTETPVPTADQLGDSEYKQLVFEFLVDRAQFFTDNDDPDGALEVVRAADLLADVLRVDFGGQVSKLFWRREALPLYELGVHLSQLKGDNESILYFLERSRSILLLEALLQEDIEEMVGPEWARQLGEADYAVKQLQRSLLLAEEGVRTDLKRQLLTAEDRLSQLSSTVATQYPGVRQRILMPDLVGYDEALSQLKAGGWDRQIHFLIGEEVVYGFSLTEAEANIYSLGETEEVTDPIRELLGFYTSANTIEQDFQTYLELSQRVHQILLEKMEIEEGERLLIIPDGLLAYLPFGALVTAPGEHDLASAPYLIKKNPISYAQSATVLSRQMVDKAKAKQEAFAFAPFAAKLPGIDADPLPYTKEEVDGMADHFRERVVVGEAATKDTLLRTASDYRILHLSTHAYASAKGEEPARILTASQPVYLADIYSLQLSADLVVLSACQSNIGPLAKGEGVLGLGRAFTAAGAKGVVASLWSLNDRATMEVVTSFYEHLAEGSSKPTALHEAQLAYLNRTDIPAYLKSPYYWAGLTYYGDAGELPSRSWPIGIWDLIIVALFVSLYVLSRKIGKAKASTKTTI